MNLKALNPKWALAFAGAAVVGVVGVVLVITLTGSDDEQATAGLAAPTIPSVATKGARTPVFTPGPPVGSTPMDLGYRVIVSGPDTAQPGAEVTYNIQYECVREKRNCIGLSFEFNWPLEAASLVQSSPEGGVEPGPLGRLNWFFPAGADGVVQVVLRVAEGFEGELGVGVYTHGTGITYSEGSVAHISTHVAAEPTP
jgi:hypothetical protein